MTMAANAVFVDANVLVYTTFPHFPIHAAAFRRLDALSKTAHDFYTSRQVLREFLAVTTRPGFTSPMPDVVFLEYMVKDFESRFVVLEDDRMITRILLELIVNPGAKGRQVHDANIAATMRRHGIPTLLTHNTADFDRYRQWITVLPLV